jgi:Raf kinase inhibitor-like YbhB/YbcL family protein
MEIRSAFNDGQRIPSKYTCDGTDVNPPLEFINVPKNTKSLILIVDDPDSPSKIFAHWILWNISPNTRNIKENSSPKEAREGINDFGNIGYGGPCPHSGEHRYQFKLFALDIEVNLPNDSKKSEVERVMKGHVVDKAILAGTYSKMK